jgi:hypothetical protein
VYKHTAPGEMADKAATTTTNLANPLLGDRTDKTRPPKSDPPSEPSNHSGVTSADEARAAPNADEKNYRK